MSPSIPQQLGAFAVEFDRRLKSYLASVEEGPAGLAEAIRYSVLAPGKRIRPYLVVRCCELVGGSRADAWPAAAAAECVHAFSLVHDDLPAMDDDDLRRGQPTTHRRYGEAMAILAGDALVVLAFELIARHVGNQGISVEVIRELASAAGAAGMIGGQAADITGQSEDPSLQRTRYIHERKTAALFAAACRIGALAGRGQAEAVATLGRFGRNLGRAFQIADDLLDVTARGDDLGKAVGKDAAAGKQTYPRCVGFERSRAAADQAVESAIADLDSFGAVADDLRTLARYAAARNY